MSLHKGQKLHPCSQCGKNFNRPGLLRKHQLKHAQEENVVKTEGAVSRVSEGEQGSCLCLNKRWFPSPLKDSSQSYNTKVNLYLTVFFVML